MQSIKIKTLVTSGMLIVLTIIMVRCNSAQTVPAKDVPLSDVSYETHVKPIIRGYCTTCHGGSAPSAGVNLKTYKNVRHHAEKGMLLKRINDYKNPMPQGGLMPRNEREMILKWAKNNYLERSATTTSETEKKPSYQFIPPTITPVNIDEKGFDFLTQLQGHWVGDIYILGQKMPWFAFDYRPISQAHVHGIFEGGSMGNLFTSFFIANFKGTNTLMARNGGILNGIYRTSYFILDEMKVNGGESYYRFVDAYGGKNIMWMELTFSGDQLQFNSYTSRFGTYSPPKKHMKFKAKKMHPGLAQEAAKAVGFPQKKIEMEFPNGIEIQNWGKETPTTSASYIWEDVSQDIVTLGKLAKDPCRIDQMPYLSKLKVKLKKNATIADKKIQLYLSRKPLTDVNGKFTQEYGYIKRSVMNEVLTFPEINADQQEFTFTYLHPGKYYVTAFADMDANMAPTKGDIANKSVEIVVPPLSEQEITIDNITFKN